MDRDETGGRDLLKVLSCGIQPSSSSNSSSRQNTQAEYYQRTYRSHQTVCPLTNEKKTKKNRKWDEILFSLIWGTWLAGLALSLSLWYIYHSVYSAGDATKLFLFTDVLYRCCSLKVTLGGFLYSFFLEKQKTKNKNTQVRKCATSGIYYYVFLLYIRLLCAAKADKKKQRSTLVMLYQETFKTQQRAAAHHHLYIGY